MQALSQIAYRTRFSVIMMVSFFFAGCAQWAIARLNGEGLRAETWGELATQFPLEFWALAMIGGSFLTLLGLIHPPNVRLTQIGVMVQVAHISLLGSSALMTGGDPVVGAFATVFVAWHFIIALRVRHDSHRI